MGSHRETRLLRQRHESGWVEVRQCGDLRSLWFDDDVLQTEIDVARPRMLSNSVNRAMLAHLLLAPPPARVLLAGCGGGGIARYFAHLAPRTRGVAVEISPAIASLARAWFDFPPPEAGWELVTGDVRDYLQNAGPAFDFVLYDIASAGFSPAWLTTPALIARTRDRLTAHGVATFNLLPRDGDEFATMLLRIRHVFAQRTLCLGAPAHDNILVMAFNAPPDVTGLDRRAADLERVWGIEFGTLLARLREQNPTGSGVF